MITGVVFVFGLLIGSFLNVCIYRFPKNESIVLPASHCPECKKPIKWYDNIPVLSYLILGGRCRFCKVHIPFRYVIVEILTAVLGCILYGAFKFEPRFLAYSILTGGLIVATFVDFQIQEIPDQVTLGGIIAGFVIALAFPSVMGETSRFGSSIKSFLGIIAGGGAILAMGYFGELLFKKEAMGGGDVKLLAMIGAFLGWDKAILVFFLAPFFGAVVGLVAKLKYGHETIPYGPYLSMAAFTAILVGDKILKAIFFVPY